MSDFAEAMTTISSSISDAQERRRGNETIPQALQGVHLLGSANSEPSHHTLKSPPLTLRGLV